MNFQIAFETIDGEILIRKLEEIGFPDLTIKLIEEYVEERKQITKVSNTFSKLMQNNLGVP